MSLVAPRFRAASSANQASVNSFTCNLPTYIPGDFLLLLVQTTNQSTSAPAGWTEVPNSPQGIGTGAGSTRIHAFYKFAVAGQTEPTISDSGDHQLAQIYSFMGVDPTTPVDVSIGGTETADTSLSATGGTTTVNNDLVVVIAANGIDGSTADQLSSFANADLVGFAQVGVSQNSVGTGGGINVGAGTVASVSTFGATTGTYAASTAKAFLTICLRPSDFPWVVGLSAANIGAGAATLAWPTLHQSSDLGVMVIETGGGQAPNVPTGYAHLGTSPSETGAVLGTDTRLTLLWRRATGTSESDSLAGDGNNHRVTRIIVIANVDTVGDPWDAAGENNDSVADTAKSISGITTGVANTFVLSVLTWAGSAAGPLISGWANTDLASLEEYFDFGTVNGNGGGLALAGGRRAATGTIGATTATSSTSQLSSYQMVALRPLVNPPTITGTTAISWQWSTALAGFIGIVGAAASAWAWSTAAVGTAGAGGASGDAASAFGWSTSAAGEETFTGAAASAWSWTIGAVGSVSVVAFTGDAASAWDWSTAAAGTTLLNFTGAADSAWDWSTAAIGINAQPITGTAASAWGWSTSSVGTNILPITGSAASQWKWSTHAVGITYFNITAVGASAWGWSTNGVGKVPITGVAASQFRWSTQAVGEHDYDGDAASKFGWSTQASGLIAIAGAAASSWGWSTSGASLDIEGFTLDEFGDVFIWSTVAQGFISSTGEAHSQFDWSTAAVGEVKNPIEGVAASTFGWSTAAAGFVPITGTAASAWGWSTHATATQTFTATAASAWGWSTAGIGTVITPITATGASAWDWLTAGQGVNGAHIYGRSVTGSRMGDLTARRGIWYQPPPPKSRPR